MMALLYTVLLIGTLSFLAESYQKEMAQTEQRSGRRRVHLIGRGHRVGIHEIAGERVHLLGSGKSRVVWTCTIMTWMHSQLAAA